MNKVKTNFMRKSPQMIIAFIVILPLVVLANMVLVSFYKLRDVLLSKATP